MKAREIMKLTDAELRKKGEDLRRELFNLRFQLHTGRLENTAQIRKIRQDIARIKTIENLRKNSEVA